MEPVTDHGVEFGQTESDPLGPRNTAAPGDRQLEAAAATGVGA